MVILLKSKMMKLSYFEQSTLFRALQLALGDRTNALDGITERCDKVYTDEIREEIKRMQALLDRLSGPPLEGSYKSARKAKR